MSAPVLQSPLHDRHLAAGAKFGDFAGWSMPLEYAGGGVVAEHTAVRTGVGVFDVSHLGKAWVTGTGAAEFINGCLTNDLARIGPGQAQYTLCCNDDGGVVDDLIVYQFAPDRLMLIPNAANTAEVVRRLTEVAPAGVQVRNVHYEYAVLAVQGPYADDTLAAMALPIGHEYFSFRDTHWGDVSLTVCRTGYTGERGYELVVSAADAGDVWDAVLEAGEPWGIKPAGLGARDTLRTEMGYPLHGQDLSPSITAVQARLAWAVGWDKPKFWGADALRAERAAKPARVLTGIRHAGRRIPRPGMAVYADDGTGGDEAADVRVAGASGDAGPGGSIGTVTSGTFGPTAGVGIGLVLIERRRARAGNRVWLDLRGRREPFELVKPPFVQVDPGE